MNAKEPRTPEAGRIESALAPVRRRSRLMRCAKTLVYGALAGWIGTALLFGVSFFVPIEHKVLIAPALIAACALLGALLALLLGPDTAAICREADALGLKERCQTAWELRGHEDAMSIAQRDDALTQLAKLPVQERMSITWPKRALALCGAVAALCVVLCFIPNPQDAEIARRNEAAAVLAKQANEIDKQADDLEDEKNLAEADRKELQDALRKLAAELRENRDYKQGLKEVSKTQEAFERIEKKKAGESLARASEALRKNEETQALGEALERKDEAALQEAIAKIAEAAQNKDGAQSLREALEEALAEMENQSTGDPALDEALKNLSNALASGDSQQIADAMNGLSEAASNLLDGSASSLENLNAMLRISKLQVASVGIQSSQGQGSQGQNGEGSGQGQGDGQGNGNGSGSGQGQGNGQGSGGGNGIGTGSTNRDAGYHESAGRSPMQGDRAGDPNRVGQFEQIYDPKLLGGEGEASQIRGDLNEGGGSEQADIGPGPGDLSGYIPYGEVVGDYHDAAVKAMDRQDIPPAMRETVEKYFSEIAQ